MAGRRLVYHDRWRDRVLVLVRVLFPDPDPDLCPGHVLVHGNAVTVARVRVPIVVDAVGAVRCSVPG